MASFTREYYGPIILANDAIHVCVFKAKYSRTSMARTPLEP